ncbi:hypothetical protein TNCV_328331 [Trichonephila clavipes]|nr:hypothetical protein TNCV_328331 [Trichonephila clavipes]
MITRRTLGHSAKSGFGLQAGSYKGLRTWRQSNFGPHRVLPPVIRELRRCTLHHWHFLILTIFHGQPARGYIHFHLQPMREHPLSSQQCQNFHNMKTTISPASRIPPSQPIACMSLRRLRTSTKAKHHIKDFKIWD